MECEVRSCVGLTDDVAMTRNSFISQPAYNDYAVIYKASLVPGVPLRVSCNHWLVVEPCLQLASILEPFRLQGYGRNSFALELLSIALCWDIPAGLAIIDLPHQSCFVCRPGRPAIAAAINSTISWLRREEGLGIVLLPRSGYAFLHVVFNPFQTRVSSDARYTQLSEALQYGGLI